MKSARLGLIIAALVFVSQFAAYTYITPFLNERSGISNGLLTMVLLANGVAGFLGNLAGGWLASRNARKAVITTSTLLGGSVLLLALTGTYPLMAVLLVVMWGFGFGMLPIAMQTWLFNKVPGQVESMQALFVTVAQAAIGAGALIGGLIVDHANVTSALLAGGVIALSTALVLTFTNRNHALAHEQD